ncbi:gamma-butyrobetaine hydroxylase-like domain-containing protein [Lacunimicrobium album]
MIPASLKAHQSDKVLAISWPDDESTVHRLPYRFLRGRCPCASCVNEFTGVRVYDIDKVSEDISIAALEYSGNYALKIGWSDNHFTGLYTWPYLQQLTAEYNAESDRF